MWLWSEQIDKTFTQNSGSNPVYEVPQDF